MQRHHHVLLAKGLTMLTLAFATFSTANAAKPIELQNQPASILQPLLNNSSLTATNLTTLKEIKRDADFKQNMHIHMQETYAGYPVWGGDAIVHIPAGANSSLNAAASNKDTSLSGMIYQDLASDLQNIPMTFFTNAQATKALNTAISLFQKKSGMPYPVTDSKTQLMVFVDSNNKAHWAYLISFLAKPKQQTPKKPTYIMDAVSFAVYEEWDNIQTIEDANGGGFGGNVKMGKLTYDGMEGDLPQLKINRDASAKLCFLENSEVRVRDVRNNLNIYQFPCAEMNNQHNNVFWNGDLDTVNNAYSPADDALFIGSVVKDMYQKWYNVPVLVQEGKPMILEMCVHAEMENAYWNGKQMFFGDGGNTFYPLVSLGVGAHEVSHGFTEQHSHLAYYGQSGGLNESFSDMAAQAAEFYAYGKNSWQIGPEIFKDPDEALRYMDMPSKDCHGGQPGKRCSIDNALQYKQGLDVHYSSGVFNRFFYLLGTSDGWDTKKAFDVMVEANMHYWTSLSNFRDAACGVIKAAKAYQYDDKAVRKVATTVGINTIGC